MRVIALISWWDESPTWLAATIASAARLCDHVVAVDGAYALFPTGLRPGGSSGPEQHEAVRLASEAAGVGLTLHVPPAPWDGNEVEKRSAMFRLGEAVAVPEEDWYLVIDADEVVMDVAGDPLGALASADEDVATVGLVQTGWHPTGTFDHDQGRSYVNVQTVRQFYRAIPGLRVEGAHHHYLAERDGTTVQLFGAPTDDLAPALDLSTMVLLEHRNHLRDGRRAAAAGNYYATRDRLGAEAPRRRAEAIERS